MIKVKRGFTMVELTLAMSFVAILLITIALVTTNIITIYQKGAAMKAINSVGRELIDDFSRSIAESHIRKVDSLCGNYTPDATMEKSAAEAACKDDQARNLIYQQQYGSIKVDGAYTSVPTHGAFCTGSYSYIWNTGYVLGNYENGTNYRATYEYDGGTASNFRLIKIADTANEICYNHTNNTNYNNAAGYRVLSSNQYKGSAEPEELIHGATTDDLALYDFQVFPPTWHNLTDHTYYSATFILATLRGDIDITGSGDYCREDIGGSIGSDFNYCAINKFNFAMRATGETIDED